MNISRIHNSACMICNMIIVIIRYIIQQNHVNIHLNLIYASRQITNNMASRENCTVFIGWDADGTTQHPRTAMIDVQLIVMKLKDADIKTSSSPVVPQYHRVLSLNR